jgi:four helix bundle protein
MRDPSKLAVIPEAEELAIAVYRATVSFPKDERFGLTSQMRRAAVSIGSNIVEGCHRQGNRAFIPFLYNALGSAAELEFQLRLATRLDLGNIAELNAIRDQANKLTRMLVNLIAALRRTIDDG